MTKKDQQIQQLRSRLRTAQRRIRQMEVIWVATAQGAEKLAATIFERDVQDGLYDYARGM